MPKKTQKVKKPTPKSRTQSSHLRLESDLSANDLFTPRKFLIIYSKFLFDGSYLKAKDWLSEQGIKVKKTDYYKTLQNSEEESFQELAKIGKNYFTIVAEMGIKLRGFEREVLHEVLKKKPNPVKINAFLGLMKIQPLLSAYDKQVKRLIERTPKNELVSV